MASETVLAAGKRIAEHAVHHRLPWVQVVLHGGEPLLLGRERLDALLTDLRATIGPATLLDLRMQSNGVLLTPAMCDVLVTHRVKVGISLDGNRSANDRHRRFANGTSSHSHVARALALLRSPEYRTLYAGILCTVDVANDPIAVYEALLAEEPPRIDFLLPHATWDSPPYRPAEEPTPYATWLARIYDQWSSGGRPVPVRLFDSLLASGPGATSETEAVGLSPADVLVVETDGAWEQPDSMKTAYDGAAATGLNVFSHSVDEAAANPGVAVRQSGLSGVSATCRACPVVQRCGGGLYAHRYSSSNGFDNPSVYCADLKALVGSIDGKATRAMSDRILRDIGSGFGETATMEHLVTAQASISRVLLSMVGEVAAGSEGWALLEHLDTEAPEAIATTLSHPYLREWAVRCLTGAKRDADQSHLACIAAAAAARAGLTVDIRVPVRNGMVHLPTLGAFAVGSPADTVLLSMVDGQFRLSTDKREWWPTRHLSIDGRDVPVEDTDPYRDCHEWPVATRLTPADAASWQSLLTAAWHGIQRDAPRQAAGVRIGLRAFLPLQSDHDGRQRSATNRNAFGAVAVAPVPNADALAVLLVHEIQHVKLGAILDLYDLVDAGYPGLLPVPWRPIPRPVEAALQGAYAHLAVADVWRSRSLSDRADAAVAAAHFRQYRGWVSSALDSVLGTGALTADGERFVAEMRRTLDSWPTLS